MDTAARRIAFIGGGNMARSIIGGLLAAGHPAERIAVGEPDEAARARLGTLGALDLPASNEAVVAGADLLVLAVKPQVLHAVLEPLAATIRSSGCTIMSIAAGVTVAQLERWLGEGAADASSASPQLPIVRCMPNTPALVGQGAAGLYANGAVSDGGRALAEAVMAAVGTTLWVAEEALIDAVIAVSGSGPAYYFLFMEKMIEAGTDLGLDPSTARALVLQTALGAARMAMEAGEAPAELRRQVTSPGGTTAAALEAFEAAGLGAVVSGAMAAAADRAAALTRELDD